MNIPFGIVQETAQMAKRSAASGVVSAAGDDVFRHMCGIPYNHPSMEWFFGVSAHLLSIIMEIVGAKASGKSTAAMWFAKTFFLSVGGSAHLIDTEHKISPDVLWGIIEKELHSTPENPRFKVHRADTQEAAQQLVGDRLKALNLQTFGKKANRKVPLMENYIIDAWRVSSEKTQEALLKAGHGERRFAFEASSWRDWLSTMVPMFGYAPASLTVVNHMIEKDAGQFKVKDSAGGAALHYASTFRVLSTSLDRKDTNTDVYTNLQWTLLKNSYGSENRKAFPRIVYKRPDLPHGKFDMDWYPADARCLTELVPKTLLKAAEVCETRASTTKPGLFNDDILGLKNVPIEEIVAALYADKERIMKFRSVCGIQTIKTIEEHWKDGWFYDARKMDGGDDE